MAFSKKVKPRRNPSKRIIWKRFNLTDSPSSPERTHQTPHIAGTPRKWSCFCEYNVQSDARGGMNVKNSSLRCFTFPKWSRWNLFFRSITVLWLMTSFRSRKPVEGGSFFTDPTITQRFLMLFRFRRRNLQSDPMRIWHEGRTFWEVGEMGVDLKGKVGDSSLMEETSGLLKCKFAEAAGAAACNHLPPIPERLWSGKGEV